jgi:DNA mismatch repair protein MutS2
MKLNEILFIDSLPSLDLHGIDRDYAVIKINEFIKDNYIMGNKNIVIVHGIGTGIIKHTVHDTLRKNKYVIDFQIFAGNVGCTIVEIIDKY